MLQSKTARIALVLLSLLILLTGCAPGDAGFSKPSAGADLSEAALSNSPSINASPAVSPESLNRPRYVFFFIGDGMGPVHKKLAAKYLSQNSLGTGLLSDTFPVRGSISTNCLDSEVTDSAAAATAFSTGRKTNKGMVGMLPGGAVLRTVLEAAKQDLGMSTGVITTTALTHATPACFAAHASSRTKESGIAVQLASSGVDFLAGGGLQYFLPAGYGEGGVDSFGKPIVSAREDGKDLAEAFRQSGYRTFTGYRGAEAFNAYSPAKGDRVFAAFTNYHTPYQADIRGNPSQNTPSLDAVVEKAISLLSGNENGFYLMVEGGLIDQAAHINDAAGVVYETVGMDKAVEKAYQFYLKHPGETLIVVAADHETGALSFEKADTKNLKDITISVSGLQSAYTGDAAAFYSLLSERFGLANLTASEEESLKTAIELQNAGKTSSRYGGYSPPAIAASKILNKRSGVIFGSYGHTAAKTPFTAVGFKSGALQGISDNAELGRAMFGLLGLTAS